MMLTVMGMMMTMMMMMKTFVWPHSWRSTFFFLVADQCLLGSGAQGASGKDPVVDIGTWVLKPDFFCSGTNLCRMPVATWTAPAALRLGLCVVSQRH